MIAYVEVTYQAPYFSSFYDAVIPGGYTAECTNAEDFSFTQVYSRLASTKDAAIADVSDQLKALGAAKVIVQ